MSLTGPVFSFDNISQSRDSNVFSCNCLVGADMPFFKGHFPDLPIMPAVAQIELINSLLQQTNWNAIIAGGYRLKFTGRIQPGDTLVIRLQRKSSNNISFTMENNATVVSKGFLQLAGGPLD
jgi:3-hydroxymyristoyl/3-hydroxydecanoyl-(acyl carrier protein) dehydratase